MTETRTTRFDLRGQGIRNVGIVSDTHGWIDPRVLAALGDCDLVLHAGDVCGTAVLETLTRSQARLVAVAGNNDRVGDYVSDSGRVLTLHEIAEVILEHGAIAIEHGHRHDWRRPPHASLRRAHPGARAIVYGHTHGLVCDIDATPWVLNPGAAGRVRTRGGASWINLSIDADDWQVQPYRWQEAA